MKVYDSVMLKELLEEESASLVQSIPMALVLVYNHESRPSVVSKHHTYYPRTLSIPLRILLTLLSLSFDLRRESLSLASAPPQILVAAFAFEIFKV